MFGGRYWTRFGAGITDLAKGDLNEDEGRSAMGAQCSMEC